MGLVQKETVRSDTAAPSIPLRILMVLPSDFDKPTKVGQGKTYEKSVPFELDTQAKSSLRENMPGFLENSFYDGKKKLLQVNCWVRPHLYGLQDRF